MDSKKKPTKKTASKGNPGPKKCWTEGELTNDDVKCIICMDILIEPVCFPCQHSTCQDCFNDHLDKTSLSCPLCRFRLSSWKRKLQKSGSLVHTEFWTRIQDQFPELVSRHREGLDNPEFCTNPLNQRDGIFVEQGQIAEEFQKQREDYQQQLEIVRQREEEESSVLISQLQEAEPSPPPPQSPTQIQADFELASSLQDPEPPQSPTQLQSDYEFARKLQEEEKRLLQDSIKLRDRNSPSPASSTPASSSHATPKSSRSQKQKRPSSSSSAKSSGAKKAKFVKNQNQTKISKYFFKPSSVPVPAQSIEDEDVEETRSSVPSFSGRNGFGGISIARNIFEHSLNSDAEDGSVVIADLMDEMINSVEDMMSQEIENSQVSQSQSHYPGLLLDNANSQNQLNSDNLDSGVSSTFNIYDMFMEEQMEKARKRKAQEEEDRKVAENLDKILNVYQLTEREAYPIREKRSRPVKFNDSKR